MMMRTADKWDGLLRALPEVEIMLEQLTPEQFIVLLKRLKDEPGMMPPRSRKLAMSALADRLAVKCREALAVPDEPANSG